MEINAVAVGGGGFLPTRRHRPLAQAQNRAVGEALGEGHSGVRSACLWPLPPGSASVPCPATRGGRVSAAAGSPQRQPSRCYAAQVSGRAPFPAGLQHGCPQGYALGRRRVLVFLTAPGFCALLFFLRPFLQTCLPRPFGSSPTRPSRGRTGEGEKGPAPPTRAPSYFLKPVSPQPSLGWVSRPGVEAKGCTRGRGPRARVG